MISLKLFEIIHLSSVSTKAPRVPNNNALKAIRVTEFTICFLFQGANILVTDEGDIKLGKDCVIKCFDIYLRAGFGELLQT